MATHTTLILVRHAETLANVSGPHLRMSGGLTDQPLSPRGAEQARLLAGRLAADPAPAAAYASPMPRVIRTLGPWAAACGLPCRLRPGLREVDCGAVDGALVEEVKRAYPDHWAANLRQADPDFRWPGGESCREFRDRCLREVRGIVAAHPGRRALVATHAGVISQLVGFLLGECPARWERHRPGNASITELAWRPDGGGAVVRFDDRRHLTGPPAGDGQAGVRRPAG